MGLLAFALGFHNATVHHIGIPNLSAATVLTMNPHGARADLSAVDLPFQPMSKLPLSYRMCT